MNKSKIVQSVPMLLSPFPHLSLKSILVKLPIGLLTIKFCKPDNFLVIFGIVVKCLQTKKSINSYNSFCINFFICKN